MATSQCGAFCLEPVPSLPRPALAFLKGKDMAFTDKEIAASYIRTVGRGTTLPHFVKTMLGPLDDDVPEMPIDPATALAERLLNNLMDSK